MINRARTSAVRTQIKKYHDLARQTTDAEALEKELRLTQKKIDKLTAKGTIHRNTAARKKAQIARMLNAVKVKAG